MRFYQFSSKKSCHKKCQTCRHIFSDIRCNPPHPWTKKNHRSWCHDRSRKKHKRSYRIRNHVHQNPPFPKRSHKFLYHFNRNVVSKKIPDTSCNNDEPKDEKEFFYHRNKVKKYYGGMGTGKEMVPLSQIILRMSHIRKLTDFTVKRDQILWTQIMNIFFSNNPHKISHFVLINIE